MKEIPGWVDISEYPFETKEFRVDAGVMNYIDVGTGDPLVMVHGNPSWSFEYRHLVKGLSSHYRCIVPDHIGFGLSDKPLDWNYLPENQAQNFEALMESLDLQNITLVVGDWGGPLGLSYAVRHPEKIKSIVITNTWFWPVNRDWYYQLFSGFMGGPLGRFLIRRYNFFARAVVWAAFGDKAKLTTLVKQHITSPLAIPGERKGNWIFPKRITGSTEWLSENWARRERLKGKIKLIAWGMKDIAFREKELNRWRETFPDARVIQFADAGHFLPEEKPEELISELKVLGENL
jgi:haloalkane dehalogenase